MVATIGKNFFGTESKPRWFLVFLLLSLIERSKLFFTTGQLANQTHFLIWLLLHVSDPLANQFVPPDPLANQGKDMKKKRTVVSSSICVYVEVGFYTGTGSFFFFDGLCFIDVILNIDLESLRVGEIEEGINSNLRSVEVRMCKELKEVWRVKGVNNSNLPILGFQIVECIKISGCCSLRNVFTPTTSNFDMRALKKVNIDGVDGWGGNTSNTEEDGDYLRPSGELGSPNRRPDRGQGFPVKMGPEAGDPHCAQNGATDG
ncbi:hypothetical protein OSB04_028591 [Centaurea solstitialis]|uniref:Uncharacterized protein n=1 Tax=Centaurea solstitialis TaxID=347529 RepID=A0AA38SG22_9ASTR|nr:hypothetical protein OSB04_028591 [Centaurea solstitialis]